MSLKERFKTDGEFRGKVLGWIREKWATRERGKWVRQEIRELFESEIDTWTGVYQRLLTDALADADTPEERQEAEQHAYNALKRRFYRSLEARLIDRVDQRMRWAFVQNADWRAILEAHDGPVLQGLVLTLKEAVLLTLRRPRLLTDKRAEVLNAEVAAFLADVADPAPASWLDEPDPPVVERHERPVIESAIPTPTRSALLTPDGDTIQPIDDSEPDDTDEDEGETVIAPNPTDAPVRAPTDPDKGKPSRQAALDRIMRGSRGARKRQQEAERGSALFSNIPVPDGLGAE